MECLPSMHDTVSLISNLVLVRYAPDAKDHLKFKSHLKTHVKLTVP